MAGNGGPVDGRPLPLRPKRKGVTLHVFALCSQDATDRPLIPQHASQLSRNLLALNRLAVAMVGQEGKKGCHVSVQYGGTKWAER